MNKYLFAPILLIAGLALGWMAYHFQSWNSEWRTPIEFYGKVVDQATNPVPNAEVDFSWTDLSPSGNSERRTKSDSKGFFALHRATGKNLIVRVSKDGYYAYAPFGLAFNYAGENQNFVADPNRAVTFRLRKKGVTEPLAYCKKKFQINRDGSPIGIDLRRCENTPVELSSFIVRCWTEDRGSKPGQKYDWRCRISVPGGGIQKYTDEFPFQAPTEGYAGADEISMPAALGQDWGDSAKRGYFLKLANGNYARMTFEMVAFNDHFFQIESVVNPSGSRNLEFDPNNVVEGAN